MDVEEDGANNMMEEMTNNLMEAACSTENASNSNEDGDWVVEGNFFEQSVSGGDFTSQWEDLLVAMALLVAMLMAIMTLLGIFLLLVGIMARLFGIQDLTRDPR